LEILDYKDHLEILDLLDQLAIKEILGKWDQLDLLVFREIPD
jgi:hypothetical protein